MSREVVGDAPDDAGPRPAREAHPAVGATLEPADRDGAGPGPRRYRTRLTTALLGLLCLTCGGGFGWAASGAWGSTSDRADVGRGTAVSATVVTMSGRFDAQGLARVETLVRVVNVGLLDVSITGTEVAYLAAQTLGVAQLPVPLGAGHSALLRLTVQVACASPLPLSLPALTLRRSDGLRRPLPVDGATAELVRVCTTGAASGHSLQLVTAARDGDRLRLVLVVPSGRTVRVVGVSAGQVALTGRPLPGEVDGQSRTVWLDPPGQCALPWRNQGLPRGVDLALTGVTERTDVTGVTAVVHLDVGYELSAWLLDRSCPASPR